jgi:hypothetical protein
MVAVVPTPGVLRAAAGAAWRVLAPRPVDNAVGCVTDNRCDGDVRTATPRGRCCPHVGLLPSVPGPWCSPWRDVWSRCAPCWRCRLWSWRAPWRRCGAFLLCPACVWRGSSWRRRSPGRRPRLGCRRRHAATRFRLTRRGCRTAPGGLAADGLWLPTTIAGAAGRRGTFRRGLLVDDGLIGIARPGFRAADRGRYRRRRQEERHGQQCHKAHHPSSSDRVHTAPPPSGHDPERDSSPNPYGFR